MESSLSALKLSDDSPLTVKLGAETMEQKKTEHGEHASDKQTSKISIPYSLEITPPFLLVRFSYK